MGKKDKGSYLEDIIDYQDHIYDPGYVTSGRHPIFQNKSKWYGYFIIFSALFSLFITMIFFSKFFSFPELIVSVIVLIVWLIVGFKFVLSKQKK